MQLTESELGKPSTYKTGWFTGGNDWEDGAEWQRKRRKKDKWKNDKENEQNKREEFVAKDVRLKAMEALSQTKEREAMEGEESKPTE